MSDFLCSEESCQANEDPIGCASNHRYYVLIECPRWLTFHTLCSKGITSKLQALKSAIDEVVWSLRLVLIYNTNYYRVGQTRLIIY